MVASDRRGEMGRNTWLFLSAIVVCLGSALEAQTIIDPGRRIDWSQVGISGGIPQRTAICATLNPGATAAQINGAIASCTNGVVYLAAGTYTLSAGIDFAGKSNVTLRGAGPDRTALVFTGSVSCFGLAADICVRNADLNYSGGPAHTASWTAAGYTRGMASYARGTTTITLGSTSGLHVGSLLILDQLNDATSLDGVFVCSTLKVCADEGPGGAGRSARDQSQIVRVTAISGSAVTIAPGLYMPNWRASQSPGAWWATTTVSSDGIENLALDHTRSPAQSGVVFFTAYQCWVANVKSVNADRSHVWLYQTAHSVLRDSYFYGTKSAASQSYGVESFTSSDNLVENNILQHIAAPLILNGSASGSVFGYNFVTDDNYTVSPTWMIPGNNVHAAGVDMTLHEGNASSGLIADIVHGTHSYLTAFRNHFTGLEPGKLAQTIPIHLYAFSRFMNIVGNVLGTPGYHTNYQDLAPGGTAADRSIFVLGWSGNQGSINPSIPVDPLVAGTLLRWGNFDVATGTSRFLATEVPVGSAVPGSQTLPPSLYLPARPNWWGTTPWPAIGPDVTGGQDGAGHVYKIPARLCYENTPRSGDGTLIFNATACYKAGVSAVRAAATNRQ
jgi:hypothetical protein